MSESFSKRTCRRRSIHFGGRYWHPVTVLETGTVADSTTDTCCNSFTVLCCKEFTWLCNVGAAVRLRLASYGVQTLTSWTAALPPPPHLAKDVQPARGQPCARRLTTSSCMFIHDQAATLIMRLIMPGLESSCPHHQRRLKALACRRTSQSPTSTKALHFLSFLQFELQVVRKGVLPAQFPQIISPPRQNGGPPNPPLPPGPPGRGRHCRRTVHRSSTG